MKRIWVGVPAIVVIVAALAFPYASSRMVELQFHAVAKHLEQAIVVPVQVVSYHRGWFTSEADTRFGTADDGFLVHHAIDHNPFTALAMARVTSTPVLDDAQ